MAATTRSTARRYSEISTSENDERVIRLDARRPPPPDPWPAHGRIYHDAPGLDRTSRIGCITLRFLMNNLNDIEIMLKTGIEVFSDCLTVVRACRNGRIPENDALTLVYDRLRRYRSGTLTPLGRDDP